MALSLTLLATSVFGQVTTPYPVESTVTGTPLVQRLGHGNMRFFVNHTICPPDSLNNVTLDPAMTCVHHDAPAFGCRVDDNHCHRGQREAVLGYMLPPNTGFRSDIYHQDCHNYLWFWTCAYDYRICVNQSVCVCDHPVTDPVQASMVCNCTVDDIYDPVNGCQTIYDLEPTTTATTTPSTTATTTPTTTPTSSITTSTTTSTETTTTTVTDAPTTVPSFAPTHAPTSAPTVAPTPSFGSNLSQNVTNDSDSKSSGYPLWLLIAVGGGAVVLVTLVTVVIVKRRKRPQYLQTGQSFENPVFNRSSTPNDGGTNYMDVPSDAFNNPIYASA